MSSSSTGIEPFASSASSRVELGLRSIANGSIHLSAARKRSYVMPACASESFFILARCFARSSAVLRLTSIAFSLMSLTYFSYIGSDVRSSTAASSGSSLSMLWRSTSYTRSAFCSITLGSPTASLRYSETTWSAVLLPPARPTSSMPTICEYA